MSTPALTPEVLAIPRLKFTIPESERKSPSDPKTVVIRMFTLGQELDALKAGGRLEYELLQRSIVSIDGRPVDQGGDVLGRFSSPVRVLLVEALNKLNMPSDQGRKDFFDSMALDV